MFAFGDKAWPGVAKLNEEAGELVQVIGKLMNTRGAAAHWDGTDLRERMVAELADLSAAIHFVVNHALTVDERHALMERFRVKYDTFTRWRHEQQEKTK